MTEEQKRIKRESIARRYQHAAESAVKAFDAMNAAFDDLARLDATPAVPPKRPRPKKTPGEGARKKK